jgi:hypothetical protein
MPRLLPLLAGTLLLAAATAAGAAGACPDPSDCAPESVAFGLLARPLQSRSVGYTQNSRPVPTQPYRALRASAYPLTGLGFWAQTEDFALSRRTSLYDFQGGAVLRLGASVGLVACYRLLGVDRGYDSNVDRPDGELGISAPFVGLLFDF